MAFKIGRAEIDNLKKRAEGAMTRMKSIREKAEETAMRVVQTVTICGTSFGFGYMNGRMMDPQGRRGVELFGVPMEAITGIGMTLFGFMSSSSKYADHLHNIGNGALAAYTTSLGVEVGEKMRVNALRAANPAAATPPPAVTSGNRFASGAGGLTDQDLLNIAQQRRRAA